MRQLWGDAERLRAEAGDVWTSLPEGWFDGALADERRTVAALVTEAATVDGLDPVLRRLADARLGVPAPVSVRLDAVATQVAQLAAEWRRMEYGEEFADPVDRSDWVPAPRAYRDAAVPARARLRRIAAALEAIGSTSVRESGAPFDVAARVADEVLAEVPGHRRARELQTISRHGRRDARLARALAEWDVDAFLAEVAAEGSGERYRPLVDATDALHRLAALVHAPRFDDWRRAQAWWAAWETTAQRLPSPLPQEVTVAVEDTRRARLDEWATTLERLVATGAEPEECRAAADAAAALPGLATARRRVLRAMTLGLVERDVATAAWPAAERHLAELADDDAEAARLRLRVRIERARAEDIGALCDLLRAEWGRVKGAVAAPYALLLETVERAWSRGDRAAVARVRMVVDRVVQSETPPAEDAARLHDWHRWLAIEQALDAPGASTPAVVNLVGYVRTADAAVLGPRLEALRKRWADQRNLVMLAWAHRAFAALGVPPPGVEDPADALAAEAEAEATRFRAALASDRAIGHAQVRTMLSALAAR